MKQLIILIVALASLQHCLHAQDSWENIVTINIGGPVREFACSPDGSRIASDGILDICIWDSSTGNEVKKFSRPSFTGKSITWSPNGLYIANGYIDGEIRLWNAKDGSVIKSWEGHTSSVRSIAWSPDSSRLVTTSDDETIKVWDRAAGITIPLWIDILGSKARSVAWSPDGSHIATGSDDGTIIIWNAKTGDIVEQKHEPRVWGIHAIAWSPDGSRIASVYDRISVYNHGAIFIWKFSKKAGMVKEQALKVLTHGKYTRSIAWSPDGSRIAGGISDNTIRIWDVATGNLIQTLAGHTGEVNSIAWNATTGQIASGSSDGTIRIWQEKY
jgi:WD40 repeat protein